MLALARVLHLDGELVMKTTWSALPSLSLRASARDVKRVLALAWALHLDEELNVRLI